MSPAGGDLGGGARFENVSVSGSVSYDSSTTGRTVECGGVTEDIPAKRLNTPIYGGRQYFGRERRSIKNYLITEDL